MTRPIFIAANSCSAYASFYRRAWRTWMQYPQSFSLDEHEGNQAQKARAAVDITCTKKLRDAVATAVPLDVDAAYTQVHSVRNPFLDVQRSYRDTQQAYRSLIGGYLAAAAKLDEGVGREAIP